MCEAGSGSSPEPQAYSAEGETEARFGTLDALIPESLPSIPHSQMTVSLFSRVKIADQRQGSS